MLVLPRSSVFGSGGEPLIDFGVYHPIPTPVIVVNADDWASQPNHYSAEPDDDGGSEPFFRRG